MATKPKKRLTPQQQYNRGMLPTQTSTGATYSKVPKVQAGPRAQATFRPTQVTFPKYGSPAGDPGYWSTKPGYRQQSARFPNAPGMPVEYNPKADTSTVQGAIDAGQLPYSKYLGTLGYKPPPRAPSSIGIPGTPGVDIGGLVGGDWETQAAMQDIEAANRADEAAARENINALAVGWGGDLTELLNQGLIDRGAYEAAGKNQFSQMAQLQRQLEQGQGQLQAQLAARGILSSGALPGGEAEINRQFQQETQTGLQELMNQIRGIRSSQAQGRAERQAGLANVRANVAQRLSMDPRNQGIPDMQAIWDPSVQSYVDGWGRRFDRNGNRLS